MVADNLRSSVLSHQSAVIMPKTLCTVSVLIIEDDDNSLLVTQRLLQREGVTRMVNFRSGADALARLSEPVDLVLLDIQLGEENGCDVPADLRRDARFADAAIVALTANVLPQDVQQARAAGFDSLIGKPLNFERFGEQVQRALAGQAVWQTR